MIVAGGARVDLRAHRAHVAETSGAVVGFLVDRQREGSLEVLALVAFRPRQGIGSALMADARERAKGAGLERLTLETTDDNRSALAFYRRLGFEVSGRVRDGFSEVLRLKGIDPSDAPTGEGGRPIRDILHLEHRLAGPA